MEFAAFLLNKEFFSLFNSLQYNMFFNLIYKKPFLLKFISMVLFNMGILDIRNVCITLHRMMNLYNDQY